MSKETRANLIFLTLFLGLSIPGAVILFVKKSDPLAGRMSLPDSVRRRVPYMAPIQAPQGELNRYVPPLTGQWVSGVAKSAGFDDVALRRWRPVISDDFIVQLVGTRPGPSRADASTTTTICLIAWDHPYSTDVSKYTAAAKWGERDVPAKVVAARTLELPADVRKEVMGGGFAAAPAKVVWLEVSVEAGGGGGARQGPLTLRLTHPGTGEVGAASSTLEVFEAGTEGK